MIISGIYKIVNTINNKCYIGSSKNILNRWKAHLRKLNSGSHHSIYLQRAWAKYGDSVFKLEILEETENLFENEQKWIDNIKPEYNLGSVGGGDNISNHPNYDEICKNKSIKSRAYLSQFTKEEIFTKFSRPMESNSNWKGGISKKTCSVCGVEIAPQAKKCVKCSKIGVDNPFYGKKHSKEHIEKMRLRKLGKKPTNSNKVSIEGVIYESQSDAAKALKVSIGTITYRLKKKWENYFVIQPHQPSAMVDDADSHLT